MESTGMKNPQTINVLLVEDDYLAGEMIKEILHQIGYTVLGRAADGSQAVEMMAELNAEARPDVILMDVEMPHMDGIEATRLIQEHCPTPVVMLTAYETPELVELASQAGAGAYLIKPPRQTDVERAIIITMARFGDMVELRHLNTELQHRNEELELAMTEIKTLSGLLPICASCKKIRDDGGYWQDVAVYIRDHSEAEFSHGLCPDCARELFPDYYKGE
jgi:AmiR/NasT family two-component response regulator